jgi:hypothetical protein
LIEAGIQRLNGGEHTKTRTDCPLRVVFMRVRIAKVDQQAIPKILGDMSPKLLDYLSACGLISAHDPS